MLTTRPLLDVNGEIGIIIEMKDYSTFVLVEITHISMITSEDITIKLILTLFNVEKHAQFQDKLVLLQM